MHKSGKPISNCPRSAHPADVTRHNWQGNIKWFFSRPWAAPGLGFLFVLMAFLPSAIGAVLKANVQIGWDVQDFKCLPYSVYLFKSGRAVPHGGAWRLPLNRGAMVVFKAHDGNTGLKRLDGIRMVKVIAGLPGDVLRVHDDYAYINGAPWGPLTLMGTLNYRSGHFDREVKVPDGKILLMGTTAYSYDGRYYGFIDQKDIEALAVPVF